MGAWWSIRPDTYEAPRPVHGADTTPDTTSLLSAVRDNLPPKELFYCSVHYNRLRFDGSFPTAGQTHLQQSHRKCMESEWVVLDCRMPNYNSADARDGILLPVVVHYTDYDFACNGIHYIRNELQLSTTRMVHWVMRLTLVTSIKIPTNPTVHTCLYAC
jgi:hypothetical protein